jgi:hypothetical protein
VEHAGMSRYPARQSNYGSRNEDGA